jgi:hypothetical protein
MMKAMSTAKMTPLKSSRPRASQSTRRLLDYMTLKLTPNEKKQIENNMPSNGLLSWWRGRATAFAIMACAARCVLAYPAASAKSECNFSNAGNTLTHKRNQLSPNTVDTLLFMRLNITK